MSALVIEKLHKTYKSGHEALKGIDLEVKQGDFFALLGPNGAGKSTTIGIICSLVNKSSGKVKVFGTDIDEDWAGAKQYIGVVPQEFNFSIFEKVFDIVVNQGGYFGMPPALAKERAEYCLKAVDLWDKAFEQARNLSGGMKRRLMIARALVHNPRLLILDEPTAGVDIEIRRSMWAFLTKINKEGITIILTTHYLEEAETLCKNIAIIDKGQIIENTSMRSLLARLQKQHFILDTQQALPESLSLQLACGASDLLATVAKVDTHTLEVELPHGGALNTIFEQLSQQQIQISSMRNKTNRLEELFLSLTRKDA